MFTDQYFDKEENAKVFDILIKWLADGMELNAIDAADPDLLDPHSIPDIMHMSKKLKMCLQVGFKQGKQKGVFWERSNKNCSFCLFEGNVILAQFFSATLAF